MPHESVAYDFFSVQQIDLLLSIADSKMVNIVDDVNSGMYEIEMANHIAEVTSTNEQEWLDYYFSWESNQNPTDMQKQIYALNEIARAYRAHGMKEKATEYEELFRSYYTQLQQRQQ